MQVIMKRYFQNMYKNKNFAIYPYIKEDGIGTYIKSIGKRIHYDYIDGKFHPLSPLQFFYPIISKYKVIHVPNFYVPLICNSKIICTIQDITPLLDKKLFSYIIRKYIKFRIFWSLKRSDYIIFTSNFTKKETLKIFPFIKYYSVIPLGIEIKKINTKIKIDHKELKYFLIVGRKKNNKNIKNMLIAFSRISKKNNIHLFILGKEDKYDKFINKFSKENNLTNNIHFKGFVSDEELSQYYSNSLGLIYASLYEGFGLPILEAMGNSCPVITSNTSSMPEVAGNAAILVNPYEIDDIKNAIQSLCEDINLRNKLIDRGLENYKRFSYNNAAEKTLLVLNKLIE